MRLKNKIVVIICVMMSSITLLADWYNKDIEYFRIATKTNRIAKIDIKLLLDMEPSLAGKVSKALHLIYQGEEYPFYYHSGDIIKSDDYLLFMGKQAAGENTFLDDYTTEAVFYLYFDDNSNGIRLNNFIEATNTTNEIKSVLIEKHIEQDSLYFMGYDRLYYGQSRFEGWYWHILQAFPRNPDPSMAIYLCNARKVINIPLFPEISTTQNIEVTAKFVTLSDSVEVAKALPKRKIYGIANVDTLGKWVFDTLAENYIATMLIPPNSQFCGINTLQFINLNNDTLKSNIGFDWLKIKGYSKPYAINSSADFYINNLNNNSTLQIPGFADSTIVLFDSISNSIITKIGNPITRIAMNTKAPDGLAQPFTTIIINDSIYVSELNDSMIIAYNDEIMFKKPDAYYHIGILRSGSKKVEFYAYPTANDALINLLQGLPANSIVAFAYNGTTDIPQNIKSILIQNGNAKINDYYPGTAYTCAFKVGNGLLKEECNTTTISRMDTTIIDAENRAFSLFINIPGNSTTPINYHFFMCDTNGLERPTISKCKHTNYKNSENSAEMITIYHKKFEQQAAEYAEYRINQGYKIALIDVEEVYKEFNFGKKSPAAIKQFLKFANENWQQPTPRYALFIGDASYDARNCNPLDIAIDYIPTFGYPVSDYWYGVFDLNNPEHKAEMIIGRIPIYSNEQFENYFTKLKSFEAAPTAKWQKNLLFMNGGSNQNEKNIMRHNALYLAWMVNKTPFCADTIMINKEDDDFENTSYAKKNDIINAINNGVQFAIFNGHGSPTMLDLFGWEIDNLNNKDKFGFLVTMSCNTSTFAEPRLSEKGSTTRLNEDYVLKFSDRGFVAAIGSSAEGTTSSNYDLMSNFFSELTTTNTRRVGDLLEIARQRLNYNSTSEYINVQRFNTNLIGDPLTKVKIATTPDFFVNVGDINITNENNETLLIENNEFAKIILQIHNAGIMNETQSKVQLIHKHNNSETTYYADVNNVCRSEYLEFQIPILQQPGTHTITISADYNEQIAEENEENNLATTNFYVYNVGILPIEPLAYWNMNANNLHFRFINPLQKTANFNYYFSIYQIIEDDTTLIKLSTDTEISVFENYIDWKPTINIQAKSSYYIVAKQENTITQLVSQELIIPFNFYSTFHNEKVVFAIGAKNELNALEIENMQIIDNEDGAYLAITDNENSGTAISPMIGPAKNWESINVAGDFTELGCETKVFIDGYESVNGTPTRLSEATNTNLLNISNIDANQYPYLKITLTAKTTSGANSHNIYGLQATFSPVAELAIVESKTNFANDTLLRGDIAVLKIVVENVSLRSIPLHTTNLTNIYMQTTGNTTPHYFEMTEIARNSIDSVIMNIETDYFDNLNFADIFIDNSNKNKELYNFNNTVTKLIEIIEDTIKPTLLIAFDGDIIQDKDYIAKEPLIEVTMTDNSRLPATLPNSISVRLNAVPLNPTNTQFYELNNTFPKGSDVKAVLRIIPERITDRENYFSFIGTDGAGNTIIQNYYLYIALNNLISDLTNYPNPATPNNANINFNFYLASGLKELYAKLEIYNAIGEKIKTINTPAKIRNNYILWDMRYDNGNLINPGTYYYRLNIISELWTEPVIGRFVFVK